MTPTINSTLTRVAFLGAGLALTAGLGVSCLAPEVLPR